MFVMHGQRVNQLDLLEAEKRVAHRIAPRMRVPLWELSACKHQSLAATLRWLELVWAPADGWGQYHLQEWTDQLEDHLAVMSWRLWGDSFLGDLHVAAYLHNSFHVWFSGAAFAAEYLVANCACRIHGMQWWLLGWLDGGQCHMIKTAVSVEKACAGC